MARPLSAELVAEIMPGGPSTVVERPTVERIQAETCAASGVALEDLVGTRRTREALRARQLAIYLSRELTDRSLAEIGRAFGGRDHSTVLAAVRRVATRVASDPETRRAVELLHDRLHTSPTPEP
jgi:chromosomal replication initiator protein